MMVEANRIPNSLTFFFFEQMALPELYLGMSVHFLEATAPQDQPVPNMIKKKQPAT